MAINEITKYDKELNTIPLGHLTSSEMNIFFSIITRMKERGDERVVLTFEELKQLSDYSSRSAKRFVKTIENVYSKILTLNFGLSSKDGLVTERFIIFSEFKIDRRAQNPYVSIKVYEKAIPLLNELNQWVRYSLHEFNNLKRTYSKTLFRLLKQYRTTGKMILTTDKFNELLGVPKSYKQANISAKILIPAKKELSDYFDNLKITKQHAKKRGNPVKSYTFTFTPEAKNSDDFKQKKRKFIETRKELATDWSKKQSKSKVDNKSLNSILGQIDETTEV